MKCPTGTKTTAASAAVATDCIVVTTGTIAGCDVYDSTGNTMICAQALPGFVLNTGSTATFPCQAGCNTCSLKTTNDGAGNCLKAAAGFFLDGTTVTNPPKACAAGYGTPDNNVLTACSTSCTAANNCRTCTSVTFCTACNAGYALTASTGACTAYPGTSGTVHPTCKLAQASTANDCNTCDSTLNRQMPVDSTGASLFVGACGCKPGYGDLAGLTISPMVYACKACAADSLLANYKSCTFDSTGTKVTAAVCASPAIAAGSTICAVASSTTVPSGYFLTSSNTFVACAAKCAACTAASVCTTCADLDSTFVAPTSSEATYAQLLAASKRALVNGVCSDLCPTGTVANSNKTACVNGTSTAGNGSGSASGVFAIFALVASLFIIF